ncbi:MAG: ArdC family protein [Elusimicrobiota bacterium]
MSGQEKIYQMVTDQIISKLEQGTAPWQKPWKGGSSYAPVNLKSKKPYRGINIFLLGCAGYSSRYWASFKQVQQMGGKVKKGEKGHLCVFWKILSKKEHDKNGEEVEKNIPLLRYYKVFNLDQVEGIEDPDGDNFVAEHNSIEAAQNIIENMPNKPKITYNEQRAYYRPSEDKVNIPKIESFVSSEEFYSTSFHELVHSTGHKSRLNRKEINQSFFGDQDYSFEELVAEFGSAFLCGESGIVNDVIDNSASYINSWKKKLSDNPKWVVQAAGKAQKAADYILDRKFD